MVLNSTMLHATLCAFIGHLWAIGKSENMRHPLHEFMMFPLPALIWLHPDVDQTDIQANTEVQNWRDKMRHLRPYVGQFFEPALIYFLVSELPGNLPGGIQSIAQEEWIQYLFGRTRRQLGMDSTENYKEEKLVRAISPLAFHVVDIEEEAEQTTDWQGTFFCTIKDKGWPDAPDGWAAGRPDIKTPHPV